MFFVHYFMILRRKKMKLNENTLCDSKNKIILKTYHSIVEPEKRGLREHHHTECELSLVVSGSGTYQVCGNEYDFFREICFFLQAMKRTALLT